MARVAMGDVWDEARAFVTREAALLVPLALATLGLAFLIVGLVAPEPVGGMVRPGRWMVALVPFILLVLFGNLAISILVLVPRSSVGEACRGALARLGRAVLAGLLAMAALMAVSLLFSVISVVGAVLGAGLLAQTIAAALLLVVALWLGIRLLPLLPLIALGDPRAPVIQAVRDAFALTRGRTALLGGVLLLYMVMFLLISGAIGVALGSVLLLIGRLAGNPALGEALVTVMSALVTSVLQAAWTVFVAVLVRRLLAARAAG